MRLATKDISVFFVQKRISNHYEQSFKILFVTVLNLEDDLRN